MCPRCTNCHVNTSLAVLHMLSAETMQLKSVMLTTTTIDPFLLTTLLIISMEI